MRSKKSLTVGLGHMASMSLNVWPVAVGYEIAGVHRRKVSVGYGADNMAPGVRHGVFAENTGQFSPWTRLPKKC